ncbi:MAG TPA: redoxin family protein [Candidatus Thalassarchaeaceae archaeon]|nr:redoxin family protein [Candidatus Thalassarchaeaceae archaeon]
MIRSWLVLILILIAPLAGCTGNSNDYEMLPEFTVLTEGESVSYSNFSNQPYVVVFSAQWCGTPCHNNMHNLNLSVPGIEVLVVSTDIDENPNGVTLTMWKESVDEYDDNKEFNQTLEYTFSRVNPSQNFATEMGIDAPGTVIFVDSNGYEMFRQVGSFGAYNDEATLDTIKGHWDEAVQGSQ